MLSLQHVQLLRKTPCLVREPPARGYPELSKQGSASVDCTSSPVVPLCSAIWGRTIAARDPIESIFRGSVSTHHVQTTMIIRLSFSTHHILNLRALNIAIWGLLADQPYYRAWWSSPAETEDGVKIPLSFYAPSGLKSEVSRK